MVISCSLQGIARAFPDIGFKNPLSLGDLGGLVLGRRDLQFHDEADTFLGRERFRCAECADVRP
jgi:hypothetical protein